jgi:hypothetical protein
MLCDGFDSLYANTVLLHTVLHTLMDCNKYTACTALTRSLASSAPAPPDMETSVDGTFAWTIQNFHVLPSGTGHCIRSPTFTLCGIPGWQLDVCPGGYKAEHKGFVSLHLLAVRDVTGRFAYEVLNVAGRSHTRRSEERRITITQSEAFGFSRLVLRTDALDPGKCNLNNAVTFRVHASVPLHQSAPDTFTPFQAALRSLSRADDQSDLTVVVGGYEFPVHRCVLAARCNRLLKDASNGRQLIVEDASPLAMHSMLKFIYTGECPELAGAHEANNEGKHAVASTAAHKDGGQDKKLQTTQGDVLRLACRYVL